MFSFIGFGAVLQGTKYDLSDLIIIMRIVLRCNLLFEFLSQQGLIIPSISSISLFSSLVFPFVHVKYALINLESNNLPK